METWQDVILSEIRKYVYLEMDPLYRAISLFRRKKYDECILCCNELLLKNAQLKGPWELKMRAMTQRVYVDDIEADDGFPGK